MNKTKKINWKIFIGILLIVINFMFIIIRYKQCTFSGLKYSIQESCGIVGATRISNLLQFNLEGAMIFIFSNILLIIGILLLILKKKTK